ncbi:hypothetical protein BH11ACT6_BH11ACT6_12420 [soil metagenome]
MAIDVSGKSGLPEHVAHLLASFGKAAREGSLQAVTSAVSDLSGRPPTPLDALARPVDVAVEKDSKA